MKTGARAVTEQDGPCIWTVTGFPGAYLDANELAARTADESAASAIIVNLDMIPLPLLQIGFRQ
jgi:hypothetical protein